jgi:hypothetical protein
VSGVSTLAWARTSTMVSIKRSVHDGVQPGLDSVGAPVRAVLWRVVTCSPIGRVF